MCGAEKKPEPREANCGCGGCRDTNPVPVFAGLVLIALSAGLRSANVRRDISFVLGLLQADQSFRTAVMNNSVSLKTAESMEKVLVACAVRTNLTSSQPP